VNGGGKKRRTGIWAGNVCGNLSKCGKKILTDLLCAKPLPGFRVVITVTSILCRSSFAIIAQKKKIAA